MLQRASSVILTTGLDVPGRQILEILGVIGAESALGMNIFRDGANAWRDVIGGRSQTIQSALRTNRENCMRELQVEALKAGAEAVIAINLNYSEFTSQTVGGGMLFTAVTGTAVKLSP
ncbi:hypothetical protein NS365_04670 [Aureimonas ureilytica]|uniref:Uncharacterized protein n=2 Tax=Aureimonas ureilytica TaxID=401562 RepID=A0A175RWW6_9HYPH|nr:hypothetical protein NS365_04670 [Aureimonas ureilytica]